MTFTPLDVTCSLVCMTPQSPVTQDSNSLIGEYEPNREGDAGTPCIVKPDVEVHDRDGVFPVGCANERLALDSMVWKMNGVDISMISEWSGKYEIIQTADENRGCLKIKKNVAPSEKWVISFEGKFEDWRSGVVMDVRSENEMVLKTTDKGSNKMSCSIDSPSVKYDPLDDDLLLYDYMSANGYSVSGTRSSKINGKSFEREFNVILTDGKNPQSSLPNGVSMGLYKKDGISALIANSESSPELLSISYPKIKMDLRIIDIGEYEVRFMKSGETIAKSSLSIIRKMAPLFEAIPKNGADLILGQEEYYNDSIVNLNDRTVTYPELYYDIQWYTQARVYDSSSSSWKYGSEVMRNSSKKMRCDVNDLGIGRTKNDNYFGIWFDISERDACDLLGDEDDNVLGDENGEILITE